MTRSIFLLAVLFSVLSVGVAAAGPVNVSGQTVRSERGLAFVVPARSPVTFEKFADPFETATFAGHYRLSGTYYYGRLTRMRGDDRIGLYFLPDKAMADTLPYWPDEGPARELVFENPDSFVAAIIPKRTALAIEAGRRNAVQGRADIWVEGYSATAICGAAIYAAKFLKADKPPTLLAARQVVERTTC